MAVNVYDENADLMTGEELLLYVKQGEVYLPIAFASSHSLSLSADTIDTSSKFSGNWKAAMAGQLGWTITAESLISNATGHMSFKTLSKLMAKREAVEVRIAQRKASPAVGEDPFEGDSSKIWNSGFAYITSLDKKADKGAIVTSSITLQGTGALKGSTGADLEDEA